MYRASTVYPPVFAGLLEIHRWTRHAFPLVLFRTQQREWTANITVGSGNLFYTQALVFVISTALLRISRSERRGWGVPWDGLVVYWLRQVCLGEPEDRVSVSSLQGKGRENRAWFLSFGSSCLSTTPYMHTALPGFCDFPSIFFFLDVVRHYLCLADENIWDSGLSTLPKATQQVGGKCTGLPGTQLLCTHLNLCFPPAGYCLFKLSTSTSTRLKSDMETKRHFHSATLSPLLQMESVGVYGFCGCKAKNKMKCDSRWEIAASGRKWTNVCKYQTGLWNNYPRPHSSREGLGTFKTGMLKLLHM